MLLWPSDMAIIMVRVVVFSVVRLLLSSDQGRISATVYVTDSHLVDVTLRMLLLRCDTQSLFGC